MNGVLGLSQKSFAYTKVLSSGSHESETSIPPKFYYQALSNFQYMLIYFNIYIFLFSTITYSYKEP